MYVMYIIVYEQQRLGRRGVSTTKNLKGEKPALIVCGKLTDYTRRQSALR